MCFRPTRSEPRTAPSLPRLSVCLLLAALLLYNPFLSLLASSNGLAVHELPRHRATVGAGELQHFSPQSKVAALPGPTVDCVGEAAVTAHQLEFELAINAEPIPSSPDDYSSHLWFRPPPAV